MKALCTAWAALLVSAGMAVLGQGGTIVGSFDWENADDLQGWSSAESWVSLANPGSGGTGGDGYLRIEMEARANPDWYALAEVDASSLFAGTWQAGMWVEFDFWAEDVAPQYVQVRWAGESGETWSSTVYDSGSTAMQTATWTGLASPTFESYQNWDYGGEGEDQQLFVEDLGSIDWIGVYVWRNSNDAQDYGLDNFNLMVPEPAESALMAASAVAIALSLRKRRARTMPVAGDHSA